ncbi:Purple acid phosphatase 22 [Nymphaea thermarum]|nr:Purple acid phosphatase 22 [Nymphaea thermarum]
MATWGAGALVAGIVLLLSIPYGAFSAGYVRPPPRSLVSVPHLHGSSQPQQVHISMVGSDHMRVSWITDDKHAPSVVEYGKIAGKYSHSATAEDTSYRYFFYSSGKIHHVKIGPLDADTTYYYRCGGDGSELSFKTPPSVLPPSRDLGQTEWTASTLEHIKKSDYHALLLPGDLSYADCQQPLWDTFGRLVEPLASSRPWMVTEGNHEIETIPILFNHPFLSYNAKWRMPYEESGSTSNLYYSFDVAGIHVIMLGSYTDFDSRSSQYTLEADLAKVDREKTPWVIVCFHAPWYNTNTAHQGEGENMRKAMEAMLYNARVDMVFAGHVHSYERFTRIYDNKADPCGPIYVTIGDGGNREGLALSFKDPQSPLSLFRESSFGHGRLKILNNTHAHWEWHRNKDADSDVGDEVWIQSLRSSSVCMGARQAKDEL